LLPRGRKLLAREMCTHQLCGCEWPHSPLYTVGPAAASPLCFRRAQISPPTERAASCCWKTVRRPRVFSFDVYQAPTGPPQCDLLQLSQKQECPDRRNVRVLLVLGACAQCKRIRDFNWASRYRTAAPLFGSVILCLLDNTSLLDDVLGWTLEEPNVVEVRRLPDGRMS